VSIISFVRGKLRNPVTVEAAESSETPVMVDGQRVIVNSWTFPGEGTRIVRYVYDSSDADEVIPPKVVQWLTPTGWIDKVEGEHPPVFNFNMFVQGPNGPCIGLDDMVSWPGRVK
jgi:hypothetical protein